MSISLRNPRNASTVAYWLCLGALVTLPLRADVLAWLPLIAAVYMTGIITLSVGYHRLFCHGAFRCHPAWRWAFAVTGVMFMYGSPIQWSAYHQEHHRHADTDGDPHFPSLWALVLKSYRPVRLSPWSARWLLKRDARLHRTVDAYYLAILAAGLLVMAAISPAFIVNAFMPGAALVLLVAGMHTVLAHVGGRPRNLWLLEYVLPAGGDWHHATHHEWPRRFDLRTRWFHLDLGALLIRAIRSKGAR